MSNDFTFIPEFPLAPAISRIGAGRIVACYYYTGVDYPCNISEAQLKGRTACKNLFACLNPGLLGWA